MIYVTSYSWYYYLVTKKTLMVHSHSLILLLYKHADKGLAGRIPGFGVVTNLILSTNDCVIGNTQAEAMLSACLTYALLGHALDLIWLQLGSAGLASLVGFQLRLGV